MGANEKRAAAYHGAEYVLDTDYVRRLFELCAKTPVSSGHPDIVLKERSEQFSEWLAKVRVQAKVEALNEAATAVMDERFDSEAEVSNWLSDRALKVSAS